MARWKIIQSKGVNWGAFMENPKLTERVDVKDLLKENKRSKYELVLVIAQRAQELEQGAKPLIETNSSNSVVIALEEAAAGKL